MKKRKYSFNFYIGIVIVAFLLGIVIVSFFYTPYTVTQMNIGKKFLKPCWEHLLGTDHFGRDILSRIMMGSQTAFQVGLISIGIGLFFGILIGSIAGYYGGIVDEILMRIMDAVIAFPGLLFALMFVAVLGQGIVNTMIALGIMSIPQFARITRSGFLQVKPLKYIDMAKSIGVSNFRIMMVHILPNVISPLIVACSMGFASAVLAEAGLSYLGLGVQPPNPSWGRMLSESQMYLLKAPTYSIVPGIFITLSVLGFNLLGDGISAIRDPRK